MRLSGALRNHIFNKYQMAMEKRPMLTQMITAGTLCAVGDIGNISNYMGHKYVKFISINN